LKTAAFMSAIVAGFMASAPTHAASPALSNQIEQEQAASQQPQGQSWYVMISLYESMTQNSCGSRLYKVSTADPIVVQGPDTITINHINAVVGEWMNHLREMSPAAFRRVNGDTGEHLTDVYFRRSEEDARKAFTRDGHLRREPGCWGSVLIKSPVESFAFDAPSDFILHEFGQEPPPPPEAAGIARELPKIPGLASRN